MTLQYPTIADCVGNTPLVRLQRLAGDTTNTLLLKLEGNNPAGSVKDRPALSMIARAEQRGQIKPGELQKVMQNLLRERVPVREGASIVDAHGHKLGHVTSGTLGPTVHEPVAMAYLAVNHAPGQTTRRDAAS